MSVLSHKTDVAHLQSTPHVERMMEEISSVSQITSSEKDKYLRFDLQIVVLQLLRNLEPEKANAVARWCLRNRIGIPQNIYKDDILESEFWDLKFVNPVGIAAGFDKNADSLAGYSKLNAGFYEIGGITLKPQPGNPSPRLFRLFEDESIINQMGFNSDGLASVTQRLSTQKELLNNTLIGANIAANTISDDPINDFRILVRDLIEYVDYFTLNISCPNTENGQLFLSSDLLPELLNSVQGERNIYGGEKCVPLIAKIAPDLEKEDLIRIVDALQANKIDGIIVGNTTTNRPDNLRSENRNKKGGLSGKPLFQLSTDTLREVYYLTSGKIPLIGVGGIFSGQDAYSKIRAGASLIQLYTALVFKGPRLIDKINRDLAELLRQDGFSSISEAVGIDHR
ncbi:MAG: quinone-dependent dihydroorotate dehydrogenase [Alphaproteobacteria bacterium]|nr:quinone-dependent dihydroorotate dehydrogenase [Alphaproteobacteria bacterium]